LPPGLDAGRWQEEARGNIIAFGNQPRQDGVAPKLIFTQENVGGPLTEKHHFVNWLLHPHPEMRPSMEQVVKHQIFQGLTNGNEGVRRDFIIAAGELPSKINAVKQVTTDALKSMVPDEKKITFEIGGKLSISDLHQEFEKLDGFKNGEKNRLFEIPKNITAALDARLDKAQMELCNLLALPDTAEKQKQMLDEIFNRLGEQKIVADGLRKVAASVLEAKAAMAAADLAASKVDSAMK
jgi:hypothetical protein